MSVQPGPTDKRYAANGVSTIYTVPFLVIEAGDLNVYLNDVLMTSGYTHTGIGDPTSILTFTTPPLGDLYLLLDVSFQRLTDYQENGDLLADTLNRDFDRIWQAIKQLLRYSGRTPQLGVNDVDGNGWYQAKGNGLRGLRDPVEAQDAVTKSWISTLIDSVSGAINTTLGIAYDAGNLFDYLKFGNNRTVDSIAALRALSSSRNQRATVLGYYGKGDGGGGVYYVDLLDLVSVDNGGSLIVANDGARWKLSSPARLDIRQWGADGAGIANSAPSIQAALAAGGTVSARDGTYNVGSMVVVSYVGTTFPEVAYPSKRQCLIGDSTANTIFKLTAAGANTACFKFEGTNPPGVDGGIGQGIHAQDKFGGFTIYPVNRNKQGVGIWMLNRSYTRLDDYATESLNIGLELDGVLSSKFYNCSLKNCNIGLLLNATALSLPNANTFTGMVFSGNSKAGIVGNSIGGGNVIIGGSIENNGTQGDSSCGGLLGNLNGSNGTACLSIYGTYFEGNAGSADIFLDNISPLPVTVLLANVTFNRVSNTHYTTSNIVITSSGGGQVKLVLMACSFLSSGDYVPSLSRPSIQIGSNVEIIGLDTCNYNESVSMPVGLNSSSSAILSGSVAADGTKISCPQGITISTVGPGVYDVTKNGNWAPSTDGYNVIVMPSESTVGLKLAFCVKTSASNFRCAFRLNDSTDYANCPFTFMVARVH